ncbi:MAG TPA: chitobiase/beta-hexosaminidase C-terminal domain-containing protein [Terracidiphilus sp.]|nr:chitobiase/beta-hexosaminidase C-terminal domain-containing protein [Terracidiphilus sp.]
MAAFGLAAAMAMWTAGCVHAEQLRNGALGIAWQVQGSWHEEGLSTALRTGDPVVPGTLLRPGAEAPSNSIIILLPDGQRVLYECFTQQQCARGFRVPQLYQTPDRFAVSMLALIRASLSRERLNPGQGLSGESELPSDEAVVALDPDHRVEVRGLTEDLPNGQYTYELRPLGFNRAIAARRMLDKHGAFVTLSIPSPGIYRATIFDKINRPRIDLFIVAARPALAPHLAERLRKVGGLLSTWNSSNQGWPVHPFQRAYLESVVLDLAARNTPPGLALTGAKPGNDVTTEPAFSPKPGVFDGDTEVALRCGTPGAAIHFTVDSSQPVDSSPIYASPIVVKGTELTIKAFAAAPGRKDSAVVTGIFRIRDEK